jgi:hypothetical protein
MDHLVIDITSKIEDEVIQSRESNSGISTRIKKGFLKQQIHTFPFSIVNLVEASL